MNGVAWLIMIALALCPATLAPSSMTRRWILWNVGQGLWSTELSHEGCTHFDAGGERWPIRRLRALCRGPHRFYLTHADWDHIGGLSAFRHHPDKVCIDLTGAIKLSKKKAALLKTFKGCERPQSSTLHLIHEGGGKSPNAQSRVWLLYRRILFPGDSIIQQEKIWAENLIGHNPRILILGHHGSQTSTSKHLLSYLPKVRVAIASARQKRHNHPHPKVVMRLQAHRIPVLKTEHWGHLIIEL